MNDFMPGVYEFQPGVFATMSGAEYHATEAMSASGAKKILQSPAHYKLMRDTVSVPTEAMQFGTAVHCGLLEPQHFDARVVRGERFDKRTTAGKVGHAAFQSLNAGKLILESEAHERALRCIDAVRAHPAASRLLDGARTELSLMWLDGRYKVPCKARLDAANHGGIVDLKTTQDASPEAFARSIATFRYDLQAAWYMSGAEHVLDATPTFFAFIVVESEPPHAVAVYAIGPASLQAGAARADVALERYAQALNTGTWHGYPDTIEVIEMPAWARKVDL